MMAIGGSTISSIPPHPQDPGPPLWVLKKAPILPDSGGAPEQEAADLEIRLRNCPKGTRTGLGCKSYP